MIQYRNKSKGGEEISTIGIGCGNLHQLSPSEIKEIISYGLGHGINLIDIITVDDTPLRPMADVVKERRKDVKLQFHIGADYPGGQVETCRNLDDIKKEFERMLELFDTDYVDYGLIHYVDDIQDFNYIMSSGIWDYVKELKNMGVIKQIGFCSHTLEICRKFIETGEVDTAMIGINPIYDFSERKGVLIPSQERMDFYRDCEKDKIAVHVMKAFAGGSLLHKGLSQLEKPLTIYQCLQYALDRPAVQSCLVGICSLQELKEILEFYEQPYEARDYSIIGKMQNNKFTEGRCIYCNHCQPCPSGIDIGLVNKYMDLALAGDEMAGKHYHDLKIHASDCIECGSCDKNCHFGVSSSERMKKAASLFGE